MIAHIKGKIIHKSVESLIVDVGGIGYEVHIPLSTYYKLPDIHEHVSLNTYTHLKEDAIQLYGFLTHREKEIFQLLISVSGVGPRLARNILSGCDADELTSALSNSDIPKLKSIPGIGGKTAERLIVELKDKVGKISIDVHHKIKGDGRDEICRDILSALLNLGYKQQQAEKAVEKVRAENRDAAFDVLLKEALRVLAKG
ncbi:MAG: Holliday junction DNA helicase RuvA [Deltaproteobacteria bacterium GWC2_42_11]|nr:MAG: Holliday junction DNA helicase RuvA [Deltaproteobacteria bacterium GWC2_42_11]HBO84290.1 Holliday junction branch migration protein RuvA [Deltaproteobacteria bacterium]